MSDQECPDCEGESIEGRGCRTCNSTGKICGSGLPPVDPEVLDRACDAAWKACWPEFPHRPGSTGDRHIRRALESAAPIIAAAAYRQGREDGRKELEARIEEQLCEQSNRDRTDEVARWHATLRTELDDRQLEAVSEMLRKYARQELRSLLTDKEGEGQK